MTLNDLLCKLMPNILITVMDWDHKILVTLHDLDNAAGVLNSDILNAEIYEIYATESNRLTVALEECEA
ncbi:MAG: hypothetical protein KHZ87_05700 [Clostridiales bacterium]|nr:hypothetical protein [Clostridiales bacterium]MBS5877257.1 hypothetical protein [Clostridiales bacterium]